MQRLLRIVIILCAVMSSPVLAQSSNYHGARTEVIPNHHANPNAGKHHEIPKPPPVSASNNYRPAPLAPLPPPTYNPTPWASSPVPVLRGGAGGTVVPGNTPPSNYRPYTGAGATVQNTFSSRIAGGHAFDDHILEFRDLGITTRDQLQQHIDKTIQAAKEQQTYGALKRGPGEIYYNEHTNTAVIHDPSSNDRGTVFRPSAGSSYFGTKVQPVEPMPMIEPLEIIP